MARGPVRCTVTLPDGKPWANATVLLVSRPVPTHGELEGADVVRATTDDRGTARAKILPGQPYSCWAQGAVAGGDGEASGSATTRYRCTQVLEDIRAGDVLRLKASERLQTRFKVQIQGLEHWKAHAPFLVRVASTGPVRLYHERVTLGDAHTFRMPPMPGPRAFVQVFGKGMHPILQEPVPLDAASWKLARRYRQALEKNHALQGLDPGPLADRYVVPIPPPALAQVQVTDADGKGVAGATLFFDPNQARSPWYEVAKTDPRGRSEFAIAAYRRTDGTAFARHLDVLVRAKGVADSWATQEGVVFAADGSTPVVKIDCAVGYEGHGSLQLKEGQPLGNQELIVFSSVQRGKSGGQIGIGPYRFRTDPKGAFEIPGRSRNYHYRVCTLLTPAQIASLGFERKYPTAPLVILANRKGTEEAAMKLRISEFIPVQLQLVGRDGSPDGDAKIYVEETSSGSLGPHYPMSFRPNRRGRLRLLCRPGTSIMVFVIGSRGAKIEQIDIPKQGTAGALETRIAVDQGSPIRGKVVDPQGRTIANASLSLKSLNAGPNTGKFQLLSNWTTMAMLADSTGNHARVGHVEHPNRIWRARQWRHFSHPASHAHSDDKGEFELWLPAGYLRASIQATRWSGDKWQRSPSTPCQLTDGSAAELQLVIED